MRFFLRTLSLFGREQAARSLNILATRGANGGHNATRRERITKRLHLLIRWREVWRIGYFMKTYQIYAALDAVEQAAQLANVARRVVQSAHNNILKRHATLMRKVILAQQRSDIGYWIIRGGHGQSALP